MPTLPCSMAPPPLPLHCALLGPLHHLRHVGSQCLCCAVTLFKTFPVTSYVPAYPPDPFWVWMEQKGYRLIAVTGFP